MDNNIPIPFEIRSQMHQDINFALTMLLYEISDEMLIDLHKTLKEFSEYKREKTKEIMSTLSDHVVKILSGDKNACS